MTKRVPLRVDAIAEPALPKPLGDRGIDSLSASVYVRMADTGIDVADPLPGTVDQLDTARAAIERRDFEALADVSEWSCLKMHAAAISTMPPLVYWNGATVDCLQRVRALRAAGVPVFFTIDAGPQVKAVCLPEAEADVHAALAEMPGVREIIATGLGPGLEHL